MEDYRVIVSWKAEHKSLRRYNVEIDGFSIGTLGEVPALSAQTTPGTHSISIKSLFGKELKSAQFSITENMPIQKISLRLNFWTSAIDLTIEGMTNNQDNPSPDLYEEGFSSKGKKGKSVILWILSVCFVIAALGAFPSLSSLLLLAAAFLLLPIAKIQVPIKEKGIRGPIKAVCVLCLFFVAGLLAPNTSRNATFTVPQSTIQSTAEEATVTESEVSVVESRLSEQEKSGQIDISVSSVPHFITTDFDGDGYERVYADLLYEYGQYMAGRKVVTVIKAISNSTNRDSTIHANTENDDHAIRFSIGCNLVNELSKDDIHADDLVTIAGTIAEKHGIGVTTTLDNCYIIGMGEIAQEIKDAQDYQKSICERYKKNYEDAITAALQAEVDSYISECVSISYSDVERNPDSYKGKKIKVSGTVAQVIEGWFDGVTLRLTSDADGNDWYISYTHKEGESRILEEDHITAYGECDGVQSVTTLLGAQRTIPRMNMKYFK